MKTISMERTSTGLIDAKLLVVGGVDGFLAKSVPLSELPLKLGRMRECDVVLAHPLVSREHCEIFERDGELHVRDLGSTNGTFVGKERIEESPLRPGDLLTVGVVTFRAIYGGYDHESALTGPLQDDADCSVLDTDRPAYSTGDTTQLHHGRRITRNAARYRSTKPGTSTPPPR
ncbi:MAG TPA: FHA domain-containing protein [Pirellulaceae bacterium]